MIYRWYQAIHNLPVISRSSSSYHNFTTYYKYRHCMTCITQSASVNRHYVWYIISYQIYMTYDDYQHRVVCNWLPALHILKVISGIASDIIKNDIHYWYYMFHDLLVVIYNSTSQWFLALPDLILLVIHLRFSPIFVCIFLSYMVIILDA